MFITVKVNVVENLKFALETQNVSTFLFRIVGSHNVLTTRPLEQATFQPVSLHSDSLQHLRNLRLQLHGAIYRPDSFVMMLRYCANLKAIRYESMSLTRIAANKSHRVIVA